MKKKIVSTLLLLCLILISSCSSNDDGLPSPPDSINEPSFPIPDIPVPVIIPTATFIGFSPQNAFLGDTITITGTNLEANLATLQLKFGDVETKIISATATSAKVIVPNKLNEAIVKLTLTANDTVLTSPDNFHLNAPVITAINYMKGFAGQSVQISGMGFRDSQNIGQIAFNGTAIDASLTQVGNTKLVMYVPTGYAAGNYPISVTIAGMTATAPNQFEVVVPTITGMTPTTGDKYTDITITGTNLKDIYGSGFGTSVRFVDAANSQFIASGMILSYNENEIKVKLPNNLVSGHSYKVSVSVVRSVVTVNELFIYNED